MSNLTGGFCSVPFVGVLFEPDGKVGFCRIKGSEFEAGNLNESSFAEIWNGPVAQAWRQEFIDGKPQICKTEMRHKQCHKCSSQNMAMPSRDALAIQKKMPRRIAFNLNGKCNLACIMCEIWKKPNGLYENNGFWHQLDEMIVDLEEVELLSGEPFIQKDTYRLIDLISAKKPDCRWSITTNLNWKLTPYVKNQLDKISIRNLIVSLDSVNPETYPKIRINGNLDLALQTLRDLVEYEKDRRARGLTGLNIETNFLIQKLNWRELPEIVKFKKDFGVGVFRTFLYNPFEHSLLSYSEAERANIVDYYLRNLTREETVLSVILPLLDSLPPVYRAQYFNHMKELKNQNYL